MNLTYSGPPENYSIRSGEWFNISANVKCNGSYCGIVTIYPVYCEGVGCDKFTNLNTEPNSGIYTKNETPYRCLGVGVGQSCRYRWDIKAVRTGRYTLMFVASSEHAKPLYSGFMDVIVRGCGDGVCNDSEDESYQTCPEDCCEGDCTGTYDKTCHKRCSGYNNCSLAVGCDGRLNTYHECLNPTTYIRCCSLENARCEHGSYCYDASCYNCSRKCDGECQSAACFGVDPDCSRSGDPIMPCCGNRRLDVGEACEWGVSGTECDRRCLPNCTCAPDVTVPERTTMTIVIATTQTTSNPWIRNPEFPDETTSTLAVPVLNVTETNSFFPGVDLSFLLVIPLFFVLVAGVFYGYRYYSVWSARRSYEMLKKREAALKKKIESVSGDYQLQKISADDAGRKILGYERSFMASGNGWRKPF